MNQFFTAFAVGSGIALVLVTGLAGRAADKTSRPVPAGGFGETIERDLPAPDYIMPQQVLLNLDNGELLLMPTNIWKDGFFNPRPRYTWMAKNGADLIVHSSPVSSNLNLYLDDGRLAMLGTNFGRTFESAVPEDLERELERSGVFQRLETPHPPPGRAGALLAFKTREGSLGVMEPMQFTPAPDPILRLRYKLVRRKR